MGRTRRPTDESKEGDRMVDPGVKWLIRQIEDAVGNGDEKRAETALKKLRRINSPSRDVRWFTYHYLGLLAFRRGKISDAEALFASALTEWPDKPDTIYSQARAAMTRGGVKEAFCLLKQCVSLDPVHRPEYLTTMGEALHRMGRSRQAERLLRWLIEKDRENTAALQILVQILLDDGRWCESIAVLKEMLSRVPDGPEVRGLVENLGIAESLALEIRHQDEEDLEKAREIMSKLDRELLGEEAITIEDLFLMGMSGRSFTELQKAQARRMWRDFLKVRGGVRLTAQNAWAAAVEYTIAWEDYLHHIKQKDLARLYGVSPRSVSLRFREMVQILGLGGRERPYSTPCRADFLGAGSGPSWEEEWETGEDPSGAELEAMSPWMERWAALRDNRDRVQAVEDLLVFNMEQGHYWRRQIDNAVALWREYSSMARKMGKIRIYKPEVWAAAVEYAIARIDGEPVSQSELAEINMVSISSVASRFKAIWVELELVERDRRFTSLPESLQGNPLAALEARRRDRNHLEDLYVRLCANADLFFEPSEVMEWILDRYLPENEAEADWVCRRGHKLWAEAIRKIEASSKAPEPVRRPGRIVAVDFHARKRLGGSAPCLCGSGKPFGECCASDE